MIRRFLLWSQSLFHHLIPHDTRLSLYVRSPQVVQQMWDRLGTKVPDKDSFLDITENDVLFAVRFFWFHEPSADLVQRWFKHLTYVSFNLKGLVHQLQTAPESEQHEPELKNSQVPADIAYVYYAHRLLFRRKPTKEERRYWLDTLKKKEWSMASFVSHFENSSEYQNRLKVEAEPHLVELDQFKIYVRLGDYFISAPIAQTGRYEPYIGNLISKIVRQGDNVVDAGANIGYHALHMAAIVGEKGKVFAFEPHPGNCELINLSIEANNFNNLVLFPSAVGDAAGDVELLVAGSNTNARLFLNPDFDSPRSKRYPVKVVKIDDCLADIPRLRFVKIDVEGAEPLAVAGMSELIRHHRPILLFEFFPDFIRLTSQTDPENFIEQIFAFGYRLYVIETTSKLIEANDTTEVMRLHKESEKQLVEILASPAELLISEIV